MKLLTVSGLKARYKLEYTGMKAVQDWMKLARRVDSMQPDGETYGGASGVQGPTEKKGENIAHTIPSNTFTVRHRHWQGGLAVPRLSWQYNKVGDVKQKIDDLVTLMTAHPGDLLEDFITGGKTATGPDGQNFYSATHPNADGTTQSNLLTNADCGKLNVAAATWPTPGEWADLLFQVIATKYMHLTDDMGNKINLGASEFNVCVPPGLMPSLLKAIAQQFIGSGESNALQAVQRWKFNPIMMTGWAETDEIVIAATGKSAFIYQVLEEPANLIVLGEDSEYFALKEEIRGLARGAYNCAYDRWQGAVHCTLS